jgi:hypothetical protein
MLPLNQLVSPSLRVFAMSALNATDEFLHDDEEQPKRKKDDIRAGGTAHELTPEKVAPKRVAMVSAADVASLVQQQVKEALQV